MRYAAGMDPDDYPRTWTKAQIGRAVRGLHPGMGLPFLDTADESPHVGPTCGDCAHFEGRGHRRTYFKCGLMNQTRGAGTDIRANWDACERWEPSEQTTLPQAQQ